MLLSSLASSRGFSARAYAARTYEAFMPPFAKHGGYCDGSTRGFLRRAAAGASVPHTGVADDQANAFARLAPLVACLAGDPSLLRCVEQAVRVTQASDLAVACGVQAARVLEAILLGAAPSEAVAAAIARCEASGSPHDALSAALSAARLPHDEAVALLGRNCHLPGSLASAVHALLVFPSYEDAVNATIAQGGCNASRAGFIGACWAAAQGEAAIPNKWKARFTAYSRTAELADEMLLTN